MRQPPEGVEWYSIRAMPIRVLSPQVSSKIAAGEVTERPMSVVKELVENSLDAGATRLTVEIRGGGIEYIRVTDNGIGISEDEIAVAFERFATSKLDTDEDLESVGTFGFRGEALPSIAAVSRVTMVSRPRGEDSGIQVDLDAGALVRKQRVGAAPGTSVTVRGLFHNLPARRKFLRSAASEATRVQSAVGRFALARPDVSVGLTVQDKSQFMTSGSGSLREAMAAVYGADVAEAMLDIETSGREGAPIQVGGLIGRPSIARSNRNHVTIYINGRWVQNRSLTYALHEAYRGFLMERRFPIAVVSIDIPYGEVDVNVHPSKTEVRIRDEGRVFAALQRAVRETLVANLPVQELSTRQTTPSVGTAPTDPRSYWPIPLPQDQATPDGATPGLPMQTKLPQPSQQPLIPHRALPALRVIGQIKTTYIAAEGPDGMYLIDQHAAHERVLFETIKEAASTGTPSVQGLMEPATVDLTPEQVEIVEAHRSSVNGLGFEFEEFGGTTFILRGVPALLVSEDPPSALRDVLDLMAEGGGYESWEERAAYSLACHGAIRAGKVLTSRETEELVRQLEQCSQPHTCPHGRPTMIHLSQARLEEEFGRRG